MPWHPRSCWNRGKDVASLLLELYARIPPLAHSVVDDLDAVTLAESPSPGANTIAWLVWHAARVQDHHVAELIDADQIWIGNDSARRFGLDPDIEYLEAVDRRWDPPVTLGVRLVRIADDSLQHLGQAAYLRGLLAS